MLLTMRCDSRTDPRVTTGCADIDLCRASDGALTKIGFDIRDINGGGSDGSRSRDLTIGPKLAPESCGVSEVRMRKGVRATGDETSRDMESREKEAFIEGSRETGSIMASRVRSCAFVRSIDIVRETLSFRDLDGETSGVTECRLCGGRCILVEGVKTDDERYGELEEKEGCGWRN
jgi:hypothetical protein